MADYRPVMQLRNGAALGELTQAESLSWAFALNRAPQVTCSIPVSHETATAEWLTPGTTEMKLWRDGSVLPAVFALTGRSISVGDDAPMVELTFQGIESYMQDALVYWQVAAYSGTTLPWTWTNTWQARAGAAYGITQGTTTGSATTQTRTIEQDESLLEAIITLAETQGGFDFAINASRELELWYPQRGASNDLILEWGTNVIGFEYEENAGPGDIITDARVTPGAGGTAQTATDATAQATYGRREASVVATGEALDVSTTYLTTQAEQAVAERAQPLIVPEVTIDPTHSSVQWGSYWLGDTVNFRAELGDLLSVNDDYRIVQIRGSRDDNGVETITLDLNPVAS